MGEDLGSFSTGRHFGKHPSSPFRMYGTPLTPWQIGPPQNQGCECCYGGPGGPFTLPLSAPYLQHAGTFCAGC